MNIEDYDNEIEKLNSNFISNPYFSAFSIMTPPHEWLCVENSSKEAMEISQEAMRRDITNVIVTEGGKVIGFIRSKNLENLKWEKLKKAANYKISKEMRLLDLVKKMADSSQNLKLDETPLYFVTQNKNDGEDIVGILTYWDLNRAPSYILTYSILAAFEQTLLLNIRQTHEEWCDHTETLRKIESDCNIALQSVKEFVRGPNYKFEKLDKWDLKTLRVFYKHDPHVNRENDYLLMKLVNLLTPNRRNRVGHPVKFIITDDSSFKDDLKSLSELWQTGEDFFKGFLNPKVRHFSRPNSRARCF